MRMRWLVWLLPGGLLGLCLWALAEEYTLVTYYPSPRGVYKDLKATQNLSVGTFRSEVRHPTEPVGSAPTYPAIFVVAGARANPSITGGCPAGTDWYDENVNSLRNDNECKPTGLLVTASGNVGIGTANPGAKLQLQQGNLIFQANADDPGDIIFQGSGGTQKARIWSEPAATVTKLHLSSRDNLPDLTIESSGEVGLATTNPKERLQLGDRWTFHDGGSKMIGYNVYYGGTPAGDMRIVADEAAAIRFVDDGSLKFQVAPSGTADSAITWTDVVRVDNNGNVFIGPVPPPPPPDLGRLNVNGAIVSSGPYRGTGADMAEAIAATQAPRAPEPGDVVVIDPTQDETVRLSQTAYDPLVAGVISTSPGVLLGEGRVDQAVAVPLALAGRVPTKVTTENGPIHRGALLVTSSRPGYAMRADPARLQPGMILGKALQGLETGEGTISVLLGE